MTNPTPGDKYRDRDGNMWAVMSNGMITDGGYVWTWDVFAARRSPIAKVEAPTLRYRDDDGDTWEQLDDGRFVLDDHARDIILTYSELENYHGPLKPVGDGNAPAADLHRALDDGQYKPGCPDYYRFPHGTQVIEIARYLTSNAGQAVQYIARSSRLDGNNKGDRVGDLRKAVDMILDEIERLEAEARDE